MIQAILLTLSLLPIADGIRATETVGMLERNHVYQGDRLQFVQYIAWEWDSTADRWQVVEWLWDRKPGGSNVTSVVDLHSRELTYCDCDQLRRIRFGVWRETSTNFDHEVFERKRLPKQLRRGLVRWRK